MGTRKPLLRTYILSWYGPFHSIEEMEEWQCQQDIVFCLYLLQGKKPNAKIYSYYCGQTIRTAPKRFKDKNHHINEIPNRRSIWIGAFENRYNKEDINIAENMFIYLLTEKINKTQRINNRSLYFHARDYNVCFISRWYNPTSCQQPEDSIKLVFPEVVAYFADTDEVKVAKRLRSL